MVRSARYSALDAGKDARAADQDARSAYATAVDKQQQEWQAWLEAKKKEQADAWAKKKADREAEDQRIIKETDEQRKKWLQWKQQQEDAQQAAHKDSGISAWVHSGLNYLDDKANKVAHVLHPFLNPDLWQGGAQIAGGFIMVDAGASGFVVSGGFCVITLGVGCEVGVPAAVVSAAGVGVGAGMMGDGARKFGKGLGDALRDARTANGSGSNDVPLSNRIRPIREGDREYRVDDPNNFSDTITDIDRVEKGTLWEEKTATGQDPRMNIQSWLQKNVVKKLDSYVRARQYLSGYENAPMGIDFTEPGATAEFKSAVEQSVEQWKAENPGVDVSVRWAK